MLLNSHWARKRLFYKYGQSAQQPVIMEHYIEQEVFSINGGEGFVVGQSNNPIDKLIDEKRCALLSAAVVQARAY